MADYIGSKKATTIPSIKTEPVEDKLTDTRIEEIYAEFNANGSGLAALAPDLANTVNKKLTQSNRNEFIAHDHMHKNPIVEKSKTNHDDIWQEADDDDDDDDDIDNHSKQQIVKPTQPIKSIPVPPSNHLNTQSVRKITSTSIVNV